MPTDCYVSADSQTCLKAFVKYVYQYRRIASVGLHQINQCVDLADWIVGEIQRLVMEGVTWITWLVSMATGVQDTDIEQGDGEV